MKKERVWIECTCAHTGRKFLWSELTPADKRKQSIAIRKLSINTFAFFTQFIYS